MQHKTVYFLLLVLFVLSCDDNSTVRGQFKDIRTKTQQQIDSLEQENSKRMAIYLFADSTIYQNHFTFSKKVIDSLITTFPNDHQFLIYKGDLYMHHGQFKEATDEYSSAIRNGFVPIAYEKRATAYIKMNHFPDAIKDLKIAVTYNSDYYYSIGYTFELMKKYDSALSYFNQYLSTSNDPKVKLHVDSLVLKIKQ
jgi:tetratricopeptide (TPR) repeat protein